MSHQVINQEFRIYSCNIADIENDWLEIRTGTWHEGFKLNELRIYYNPKTDRITLIKDNKLFDDYMKITESYLYLSESRRNEIKEIPLAEAFRTIFAVLDAALECRKKESVIDSLNKKVKEVKKLMGYQIYPDDYNSIMDILNCLYDSNSPYSSKLEIYMYGYIQGKRAERAKKKQHCEVIA